MPNSNAAATIAANLTVAQKFRGPPFSGNGGYVSGMIAAALTDNCHALPLERAVEVTLRAPTPLGRALQLEKQANSLRVRDGETLIAEALITTLAMDVPQPATWDEALSVREQSYSLPVAMHPHFGEVRRGAHPICFCCGAELAAAEGLHVYSAPVATANQVAAAWIPHPSLADESEVVRPEYIWTALDCPGQMAWRAVGVHTGMLGRLTARIERPVRMNERCVVIGWTMANEGRKYMAGTALFNSASELCAYAKAVWIGSAGAIVSATKQSD